MKTIQKDKRVIFCKDDHIYEVREKSLMDEFNRRLRSTTCGMASVWLEKRIFSPRYKWASLFLISHKIFRWLNPFLLILLALLTLMLADGEYLKLPLVLLQTALYLFAFIGWIFEKLNIKIIPFNICLFFILMNIGMFFAFFRFIAGMSNAKWKRDN